MEIIRNSAVGPYIEQGDGVHAYISFKDCRVPAENLLGNEGQGFHVAQTRLGGVECTMPCARSASSAAHRHDV
jgi:acyl-CoA dehydrogenase